MRKILDPQMIDHLNLGLPVWVSNFQHKVNKSTVYSNIRPVQIYLNPKNKLRYSDTYYYPIHFLYLNSRTNKHLPGNIELGECMFLTREEAVEHYNKGVLQSAQKIQDHCDNLVFHIKNSQLT